MSPRVDAVSWKAFTYVLSGILTTLTMALVSLGAWAMTEHGSHPHAGAVSQDELQLVLKRLDSFESDIKADIREMRVDLKSLIAR